MPCTLISFKVSLIPTKLPQMMSSLASFGSESFQSEGGFHATNFAIRTALVFYDLLNAQMFGHIKEIKRVVWNLV